MFVGLVAAVTAIKMKPTFDDRSKAVEPTRPAVCSSIAIVNPNLTASSPTTITIYGIPPTGYTIASFTLVYYNLDNLYGPGNPKPILYGGQAAYKINCTRSNNSCTFTTSFSDLNRGDENWNNQLPVHVQANGYFTLNDGRFSAADPRCVTSFTVIRSSPLPKPTNTPVPTTPPLPQPCVIGSAYCGDADHLKYCIDKAWHSIACPYGGCLETIRGFYTCKTCGASYCSSLQILKSCIPTNTGPHWSIWSYEDYNCCYQTGRACSSGSCKGIVCH